MKKKYIILTVLTLGLGAGAWAIYKYVNKQSQLLQDYSVSLLRIQIGTLSESLVTIYFTMRITNKSAVEATIEKVYADIYLNGTYVGNVINDGSSVVPAKGSGDIKLSASIAGKELLKNIVAAVLTLAGTKDVPYRINGYVKLKSGGLLSVSVPFDYTGQLKEDMLG